MINRFFKAFTVFVFAVLVFAYTSPQAFADPMTELILDDGLGDVVTVDVSGGVATVTNGACPNGCFISPVTNGDHKSLVAFGTLGQFEIIATGKGWLSLVSPTLADLNQINATSLGVGPGTLTTTFTDTGYATWSPGGFALGVAGLQDIQINNSKTTFQAFANTGNTVTPLGTLIGQFTDLTGSVLGATGNFANPFGTGGALTERTVLNFSGAGTIQANFTVASVPDISVPEPTSVVLFGSGLLMLAAALRRKFMVPPSTLS